MSNMPPLGPVGQLKEQQTGHHLTQNSGEIRPFDDLLKDALASQPNFSTSSPSASSALEADNGAQPELAKTSNDAVLGSPDLWVLMQGSQGVVKPSVQPSANPRVGMAERPPALAIDKATESLKELVAGPLHTSNRSLFELVQGGAKPVESKSTPTDTMVPPLPAEKFLNPSSEVVEQGAAAPVASAMPGARLAATGPTVRAYEIRPVLADSGWSQAIGQRVVWMAQENLQHATLTVNPPDLGSVQILLQIENQQASVQFLSTQPEVRQALQNAIPLLSEMFAQSGIQLGQTDVGSHNQDSGPWKQAAKLKQARAEIASTNKDSQESALEPLSTGQGLINLFA